MEFLEKFVKLRLFFFKDRWKNDLAKYKKMESKQIDECHDEIENYSDDDKSWSDVEEAYFANPGDVHSPRITSLTAISLVRSIFIFNIFHVNYTIPFHR